MKPNEKIIEEFIKVLINLGKNSYNVNIPHGAIVEALQKALEEKDKECLNKLKKTELIQKELSLTKLIEREISKEEEKRFYDKAFGRKIEPNRIQCDKSSGCQCDDCQAWVYQPSSTATLPQYQTIS